MLQIVWVELLTQKQTKNKTHLWDVTIIYINVRSALPCLIGLHDLRAKIMYVVMLTLNSPCYTLIFRLQLLSFRSK